MKLVNPYHWLYSKIYLTKYKIAGSNHRTVVVLMTTMPTFNLVVIAALIDMFFYAAHNQNFLDRIMNALPFLGLFLYLINYFYFMFNGAGEKVIHKFDVLSQTRKRFYYVPGLLYIILSIAALFIVLPLRSKYGFH